MTPLPFSVMNVVVKFHITLRDFNSKTKSSGNQHLVCFCFWRGLSSIVGGWENPAFPFMMQIYVCLSVNKSCCQNWACRLIFMQTCRRPGTHTHTHTHTHTCEHRYEWTYICAQIAHTQTRACTQTCAQVRAHTTAFIFVNVYLFQF